MCGRFFIDLTEEQLIGLYHFEVSSLALIEPDLAPRFNIAPTTRILACRSVHAGGGFELAPLRWGLIPHWAKANTFDGKTFNARSETAAEKPAFRDAFATKRCLIPASGFYEWPPAPAPKGRKKQPYKITLNSGPMMFAGLWSSWQDPASPGSPPIESCTVLTRPAEGPIADVHHRMPVMLPRSRWGNGGGGRRGWLDEGSSPEGLTALLMSVPVPDDLEVVPVSTRVNSVANNDESLLDPIDPAQEKTGDPSSDHPSLFD